MSHMTTPLLDSSVARCAHTLGLSSVEALRRLEIFGRNEVPVEVVPKWKIFARQFTGTMPVMLILACLLSAIVLDWEDFGIIAAMLLLNATIAFYEESKAMGALDALRAKLVQEVSVLRDGQAVSLDIALLVPGTRRVSLFIFI